MDIPVEMTPADYLRRAADSEPSAVCILTVGKDGQFFIDHSNMPVPFLCMMKEVLQSHLNQFTTAPKEKKSPILTPVTPLLQKL